MNDPITKGNIMQNMVWRFGERILAQITTFVVSVVLARKLSASAFGNVALLMVFIDIANIFVVQGFASALVQKKDADSIDFSSVFFFSLVIGILLYSIAFIFAPLMIYIGDLELPALFRVLALRVPLAAINSVQHAYVQRNLLFRKFFFSTLIGTLVSAVVGIYMAYANYGAWAIVGQYLTNSLCDTVILWCTIKWRPQLVMDFKRLKTLISFGWKMLCSGLVHVIYNKLTTFFIGTMYSTQDLAYYEQGQKIPGILETNIDVTINSVLFPVMAYEQNDRVRIKRMIRNSICTTGSIIWPMMMGLAILSDRIIVLIYGEKWLPATLFMIIACMKLSLEPIQTANLQAIKAIGRSDLYLRMEILKKTYGVLAILIGVQISVIATAVASATQFVFAAIVNGAVNRRLFDYNIREQLSDIFKNALLSLLMVLIVYLFKSIIPDMRWLSLLLNILVGMLSYVMLMFCFNRNQFDYLITMVLAIKKKARRT